MAVLKKMFCSSDFKTVLKKEAMELRDNECKMSDIRGEMVSDRPDGSP